MKITQDVFYVGVNDREIDLFEGQFDVPNGMAYNSYVIKDEKTAVMDSVGGDFGEQWISNIKSVLGENTPDYLIVQHMEPDHSANVAKFLEAFPNCTVAASSKAFQMMQNFFGTEYSDRRLIVGEGDCLSLGSHNLKFVSAPMVHWPEVIMTYDEKDRILFSADAFGKFGTIDTDEDWACEARRYYFGIVGKYGAQVTAVLNKLAGLDVSIICALHGPVLSENLEYYINLYKTWASYGVESEGIAICYTSVYGNTEKAVKYLAEKLAEKGCPKVAVTDLARDDMAEAVEDAFRYGKLVLATTTYNAGIFPFMHTFISELTEKGYRNRKIGLIENGSWAPNAAKTMKAMFENSKNITFADTVVTVRSALKDETLASLDRLADEMLAD